MKYKLTTALFLTAFMIALSACSEQVQHLYEKPEIISNQTPLRSFVNPRQALVNAPSALKEDRYNFFQQKQSLRADLARSFGVGSLNNWVTHLENQNVEGLQDSQFAADIMDIRGFSIKLQELISALTNEVYNKMALIDLKLKEEGVLSKELQNFHPSGMMYNSTPPFQDRLNFVLANIATVNDQYQTELKGICQVLNNIDRELNAAGVETLSTRDHTAWDTRTSHVNRTLRRRFHPNPLVREAHTTARIAGRKRVKNPEVPVTIYDTPSFDSDNNDFVVAAEEGLKKSGLAAGDFVAPIDESLIAAPAQEAVPSQEVDGSSFIKKSEKRHHKAAHRHSGKHFGYPYGSPTRRHTMGPDVTNQMYGHPQSVPPVGHHKNLFPSVVNLEAKNPIRPGYQGDEFSFVELESNKTDRKHVARVRVARAPVVGMVTPNRPMVNLITPGRPVVDLISPGRPVINLKDPKKPVIHLKDPKRPVLHLKDPKKPVLHLKDPKKPVINLIDPKKPVLHLKDPKKPVIHLKDPKKPVIHLKDPKKPVLHLKDPKKPVLHLKDPKKPVLHLKDPKRPVLHLKNPKKPVLHLKDPKKPVIHLKDPKKPVIYLKDPKKPVIDLKDPKKPVINLIDPGKPRIDLVTPGRPVVNLVTPGRPVVDLITPGRPRIDLVTPGRPVVDLLAPATAQPVLPIAAVSTIGISPSME